MLHSHIGRNNVFMYTCVIIGMTNRANSALAHTWENIVSPLSECYYWDVLFTFFSALTLVYFQVIIYGHLNGCEGIGENLCMNKIKRDL